jgi:hypothetical protein
MPRGSRGIAIPVRGMNLADNKDFTGSSFDLDGCVSFDGHLISEFNLNEIPAKVWI